jgi:hypothetical protein
MAWTEVLASKAAPRVRRVFLCMFMDFVKVRADTRILVAVSHLWVFFMGVTVFESK